MLLDKINQPNDVKKLEKEELKDLAQEIREFLIDKISTTGGHLASNLGVVELTMALHLVLNLPEDKIVWDVGHQAYTHKILTGRREGFDVLRKYGGMSGFPKRKESNCDCFDTGHSSTSISAALGYVQAREIQGEDYTVAAVIGDGALTGGMAYEALNNASRLKENFIIILNDNNMSISENVGGMSSYLGNLRTAESYNGIKESVANTIGKNPVYGDKVMKNLIKLKSGIKQLFIPGMFFEDMGIKYLGPVEGHNLEKLVKALKEAKKVKGPVLVHVMTHKGHGYVPAERHPSRFHGTEPFDIETGLPLARKKKPSYTNVFSTVMFKLGARNEKVVAITAAMPDGTGLKRFRNVYKERFFDVGIAEEHAVTFAAGLAAGGMIPIVAIYSSFLQRAYDQIIHDVCIQNLPVVFAIDRAGLVGSDGETHQGIFDISFLSGIPNMHIMAPKNKWELSDMMKFAVEFTAPIAIRYPRGEAYDEFKEYRTPIVLGKSETLYDEDEIALFAFGSMVKTAKEARDELKKIGYNCTLINARFAKPFDEEKIKELAAEHKLIVTLEEGVRLGGLGERVANFVSEKNLDVKVEIIAIPDEYVEHGNVDILKKEVGVDTESVVKRIVSAYVGL
jgi:1-deoxy-D-xylulose-5-phosphate synthase